MGILLINRLRTRYFKTLQPGTRDALEINYKNFLKVLQKS